MTTHVVNVRKFGPIAGLKAAIEAGTAVYIGRAMPRQRLAASGWGNPFKIGEDGTREEVIEQYRTWIAVHPELRARLPELKGKELACWCFPQPCHGDVLVELVEALR